MGNAGPIIFIAEENKLIYGSLNLLRIEILLHYAK